VPVGSDIFKFLTESLRVDVPCKLIVAFLIVFTVLSVLEPS